MPSSQLDSLYSSVAKKVLTQTLRLKKGECLTIEAWNNGLPFAKHAVAEARAMGCTAITILEDEDAYVEGVRRSPKESLGLMGKNEYSLLSGSDAYIFVPGQALGAWSKTLTPAQLGDSTKYNASWYEAAKKAGLRGARMVFGYVGKDVARMLGRSIDELVRGQLKAALVDNGPLTQNAGRVASLLGDGSEVTLQSSGSTLRFSVKGEMEVQDGVVDENDVADGNNMAFMPPGLVTKEVDQMSVDGTLKVSETLTKFGILPGAELTFKAGKLVSWKSKDLKKLESLVLPIAEEKRHLTLMGVGLNPVLRYGFAQDRFVRGTVTLAGLGFNAVMRNASLSVSGSQLFNKGTLSK